MCKNTILMCCLCLDRCSLTTPCADADTLMDAGLIRDMKEHLDTTDYVITCHTSCMSRSSETYTSMDDMVNESLGGVVDEITETCLTAEINMVADPNGRFYHQPSEDLHLSTFMRMISDSMSNRRTNTN